jgi:uncharacterized protein (DUF2235 family)
VSTNDSLTNVSRLSRCMDLSDDDGHVPIVHYRTGVGTGTSAATNNVDAAIGRGEYIVYQMKG